jgi:hypothetical protein
VTPPPVVSPPAPGAFPRDSTTGVPAGVALTPSGGLRVTTPNAVLDSLDISGDVSIEAPGVVIKNSRIHGNGDGDGISVRSGSVQIFDSEIFGFENAIGFDNWAAYRVDIHSTTGDGVKFGSNVTLQDSWIHDLTPGPGAHADGGQMQGGVRNLVVTHNTIDVSSARSANSALFLAPDLGPSADGPVTIAGNYLAGGNYTLFCVDGADGRYLVKNITIRDNVFGRSGGYGAARINVPVTWANNVWADSGAAVRY